MKSRVYEVMETPLSGIMLLEASAGTGKTYALEHMVVRLVGRTEDPIGIDEILVVTFTNRAAAEMKERIRRILVKWAKDGSKNKEERRRYREALSNFDNAAIYTIHAFCRMVLSTWPFESSAPFRQDLVPGGSLETQEARAWFASLDHGQIDSEIFTAAYRQAGSGEALIASLVARLVKDPVPPGAVLLPRPEDEAAFLHLLDESRDPESGLSKASDNLFERSWSADAIKNLIKTAGGANKTAGSLEKIISHMSACRGRRGLSRVVDAMFTDPSETKVNKHFHDLLFAAWSFDDPVELPNQEQRQLLAALRSLLDALHPYIDFRPEHGSEKVISLVERYMQRVFLDIAYEKVKTRLEKLKDENGHWGYADLIRRVGDSLDGNDSPLRRLLQARYRAGLIDEFQDTDPRQWGIFQKIFDTPDHLLILIGDPKQSIYGFRGTGLQAYNAARNRIPEEAQYRLNTNYRSCEALVDSVNHFFAAGFRSSGDGSLPVGYRNVKSGKDDPGSLIWPRAEIPLTLFPVNDESEGLKAIVAEVRRILDPAAGGKWADESRDFLPSDIAVLVRSLKQENDVLDRFEQAGIPALRFRYRSVFQRPIVDSLVGLLQAIASPQESALWRSVLLNRFFRLPPDLLRSFEDSGLLDGFAENGVVWKELFNAGRSTEAFDRFFDFGTRLGSWAAAAGRQETARRLEIPWPHRILSESDGERQWQDWRQLIELIQQKESDGLRDVPGLLRWIVKSSEDEDPENSEYAVRLESEAPAVRVMTMHAAKGLEFPLVFLHGGYRGKTARSSEEPYRFDDDGVLVVDRICREANFNRHRAYAWEEDKRLWYVAFTRAVNKLWVPLLVGEGAPAQLDSLWSQALDSAPAFAADDALAPLGLPPHETLARDDIGGFREALLRQARDFSGKTGLLHILEAKPEILDPLPAVKSEIGDPAPLPASYTGTRDPATGSYSSLIRQTAEISLFGEEDRDLDAGDESGQVPDPKIPLPEDRGALFGTLMHAYLEECDFALARDDDESRWDRETDDIFADLAGRYYPPEWYRSRHQDLKKLVRTALRAPIPGLGRLCDLEEDQRRAELEFQIYAPNSASVQVADESIRIEEGYLKGFIDLLVRREGRWWVIDWKSNLPRSQTGDLWGPSALAEMMDHHHYHFQYELYLLALCRNLSVNYSRPVNWDKEIGGGAYLFLRGLSERGPSGIFAAKPSVERMSALASSLGFQELFA